MRKNGYEYRLVLLLNFPRAAVLNLYDVKWLLNCFKQKKVASKQKWQPFDVIKIQNGGVRKILKRKWAIFVSSCLYMKLSFHLLKKELKFRLYFQQFNLYLVAKMSFRLPHHVAFLCCFFSLLLLPLCSLSYLTLPH